MSSTMIALIYVIARLKEPSTYAGLGGLMASYHFAHSTELAPLLVTLMMTVASIVAVFLPEKSSG